MTRLGVTGPLGHAASQAKQFYDFYHPPFIKITPYVWNGFSEFGGCFFCGHPKQSFFLVSGLCVALSLETIIWKRWSIDQKQGAGWTSQAKQDYKINHHFNHFFGVIQPRPTWLRSSHHFFPTFCLLGHRKISRYLRWCLQVEGPLNGAKDEGPAESADKVVKVGMAGKTPNLPTDEGFELIEG